MTLLNALTDMIAVLPLTGLVATIYLAFVWSIKPRSVVLGLLTFGAVLAELVALFVGPLAWRSIAGLEKPSAADAGLIVGLAIVVCIAIPHVYAVGVFVLRRRASA